MHGRRRRFTPVAGIVLLLLLGAGIAASGGRFAAVRVRPADAAELTLFPSGAWLAEASLGYRHLVADFAWITAIQYYGRHRQADRRYPLAAHLMRIVTDADPRFESAYLFGALVLVENGQHDRAAELLAKGVRANPRSWRLWFELGFFHYIFTRSWTEATRALRIAARLPGAADYVRRLAAAAAERAGDAATAVRLWETIATESGNEEIRRIARDRLARLQSGPTNGGRVGPR